MSRRDGGGISCSFDICTVNQPDGVTDQTTELIYDSSGEPDMWLLGRPIEQRSQVSHPEADPILR